MLCRPKPLSLHHQVSLVSLKVAYAPPSSPQTMSPEKKDVPNLLKVLCRECAVLYTTAKPFRLSLAVIKYCSVYLIQ